MKTPSEEVKAAQRRRMLRDRVLEVVRQFGHPVDSVDHLSKLMPGFSKEELGGAIDLLLQLSSRLPGGGGNAKVLEHLTQHNQQLRDRIGRLNDEVGQAERRNVELLRLLEDTERENVDNEFKVRAVADMFDAWLLPIGQLPLDTRKIAGERVERKLRNRGGDHMAPPPDTRIEEVRAQNPEPHYPSLDAKLTARLAEYPTTAWVIAQIENLAKLGNIKVTKSNTKKGKTKK